MANERNVPELRFEGFNGEWDKKFLGDLLEIWSATRVHKDEWKTEGVPFFRSSDVVSAFMGKDNIKAYISHELYHSLSAISGKVIKDDVLVTGGGSIAIPYFVKNDDPLYFKDGDLLLLRDVSKSKVNGQFLFYFFASPRFRKYVTSITHIGTISHYTIEQAKTTPVILPKIKEQNTIGNFFRNLDDTIAFKKQQYEQTVNIKKAMLEKMFPRKGADVPEIRFEGFTGTWGSAIFGAKCDIVRGGSPRPIDSYITTAVNGINWIKIGDVDKGTKYIKRTNEKIKPEGLAMSRLVKRGDFILSNSMSFGRPYIMQIEGCIHDGWLAIQNYSSSFNTEFLYYLLASERVLNQYMERAAGSTVKNLNKDLVASIEVIFPQIDEQIVIAKYFSSLDTLIESQQEELEKFQNVKKACLSKMFV